jgi:hypothetical protein
MIDPARTIIINTCANILSKCAQIDKADIDHQGDCLVITYEISRRYNKYKLEHNLSKLENILQAAEQQDIFKRCFLKNTFTPPLLFY